MLCNFAPVNEQLLKTGNMNKNLFAIMALAAMPTLTFAQQTESSTESPVKLKEKTPNSNTIKRDILLIPTVTIDGRILRFYNQFENDITVKLAVNDGHINNPTVLYTYAKAPEENQVIIPNGILSVSSSSD